MANQPKTIVKFTRDYEVQDSKAGTEDATVFKKGQRKALPDESARHFVKRGVAEMVRTAKKKA